MSGKEEAVNAATVVINNIGTKFGFVNTGTGAKNPDGTWNVSGLAQGATATTLQPKGSPISRPVSSE